MVMWFHPLFDALFTASLPFRTRLRLLAFQPAVVLVYALNHIPASLVPRTKNIRIPVRNGRTTQALLYLPLPSPTTPETKQTLRPLHLDIHGGAFVGGHVQANWRFCSRVRDTLDTIVVSATYRFAPRHPFPAAIDDIDDVVDWLLEYAERDLGADMSKFTIGASSAGGNLALATCLRDHVRARVQGVVTFYAPIDLTIPPAQKPRPPNFPKKDPFAFLLPLYDAYALSGRDAGHVDDPRLSPCLMPVGKVPRTLMVIPMIDILVHEQLAFVERVNGECEEAGTEKKVEAIVVERGFHGWLELPSLFIDERTRDDVFARCVGFIKQAQHGSEG